MTKDKETKSNSDAFPCAFILAGGKGTRLRPLTDTTPKPLLPLGDKSSLAYLIEHLYSCGGRSAIISTGYMGDKIEKAIGTKYKDMKISYIADRAPKGTAGALKAARDMLGDEFAVLCADAYTTIDLRAALAFHRKKDASATLVLTHRADPVDYGVAKLAPDGRLSAFAEKPSWDRVFSDTVNTGIYFFKKSVLDHIGSGVCDFGYDLFSSLINGGERVFGYVTDEEWCDVGDIDEYYRANMRLSGGENVIGDSCSLGRGTSIRSSILFDRVRIGDGSKIDGAIIGKDCVIGIGVSVGRGSVIGAFSVISDYAKIGEGTILDCASIVPSREKVEAERFSPERFGEGSLSVGRDKFTISAAKALGRTLDEYSSGEPIAFICGEGERCEEAKEALIASVGAPIDAGVGFPSLAAFAARKYAFALTVCIDDNDESGALRFTFFDKYGFAPGVELDRKLRSGHSCAPVRRREKPQMIHGIFDEYISYLCSLCPQGLSGKSIVCGSDLALEAFSCAARKLGAVVYCRVSETGEKTPGLIRVGIGVSGRRCGVSQGTHTLDFFHVLALLIGEDMKNGRRVFALPTRSPDVLVDLCRSCGAEVKFFSLSGGKNDDEAKALAAETPYLFDGCACAVKLLSMMMHYNKSVGDFQAALPRFCVAESIADCPSDERASILSKLGEPAGEGVLFSLDGGAVRVSARKDRGFSLMAEAAEVEDAADLVRRAREMIEKRRGE